MLVYDASHLKKYQASDTETVFQEKCMSKLGEKIFHKRYMRLMRKLMCNTGGKKFFTAKFGICCFIATIFGI